MQRLLIALVVGPAALLWAQAARAQDVVHYIKQGENKTLTGVITEETPAKVTIRANMKAVEVRVSDITDVDYQPKSTEKIDNITWRKPASHLEKALDPKTKRADRPEELQKALESYRTEVGPQVAESKRLNRQVQFRIAEVLTLLAEDDPKQADAAIEAATKFKENFADGWQLVKATKLLVRLLEQKGDEAGVQKTYDELAQNAAAPKEVRQEFGLLVVRHLLRKGKPADAATKAKAIQEGLPADDPQTLKLKVYLAACDISARKLDTAEKDLKAVIEGGADNDVKALALNTLGDYYQAKGQGGEAFWQYLWVDVVYNQDREELSRALYNLAKLFGDVRKDPIRAKECLERLSDEKQFGGLDYHRKALAEKSAGSGG